MHTFKLAFIAAMLGAASSLVAAEDMTSTTRDQRMGDALSNYRSTHSNSNYQPGPAERAENSMKRGANRAGSAIKHGAQKTGHAIANGARKTGAAIERTGDKMKGSNSNGQ